MIFLLQTSLYLELRFRNPILVDSARKGCGLLLLLIFRCSPFNDNFIFNGFSTLNSLCLIAFSITVCNAQGGIIIFLVVDSFASSSNNNFFSCLTCRRKK